MVTLIRLKEYPVSNVLKYLLQDKSTKRNIIFATDAYGTDVKEQITTKVLLGIDPFKIQPRVLKSLEEQSERTRKKAEVFTPSWLCNKMNNHCDEEWFGGKAGFNTELEQGWAATKEHIQFGDKSWQSYVESKRLEITCGEAPYIVSRYDTSTGNIISIFERIGILDRKLRVVNENTDNIDDWLEWVYKAYRSVYGYEFQGDSLLIARINLLVTFVEYMQERWGRVPEDKELKRVTNIICWNLWQMDGISGTVPYGKPIEEERQISFFDNVTDEGESNAVECKIYDWKVKHSVEYKSLREGSRSMKFDFVVGNPPYQEETIGENDTFAPPVYNKFMDAAYMVADKVELIHPARFLFNAGSTPKAWNEKMLKDSHFKVLKYESDSTKIFNGTDIKGGVVITYYDKTEEFGAIDVFTPYESLNTILHKVRNKSEFESFSKIVITRTAYRLTEEMHKEHPEAISQLSKGHPYDMSTNIFERLPQIFFEFKPNDGEEYIQILGREKNERVYKFIRRKYVNTPINLDKYKIYLPKANGTGAFGERLSSPTICEPKIGATETFLSIGAFNTSMETEVVVNYIKTKFCRALLSVLKSTQDITPEKWKYVPLQDFTSNSDIDWTSSVHEIDKQLYAKYGLSDEEIDFIESHVKEME